jgi:hypothetical protein
LTNEEEKVKNTLISLISVAILIGLLMPAISCQETVSETPTPTPVVGRTFTIYATREGLVGNPTANRHVIQERDHFVALPSSKSLCSNGGHEYEVRLTYQGKSVVAPVWDIGPWNTEDDYWNLPSQREMWQDLSQGMPEAQAAYETGYNGGFDETNYLVDALANTDVFGKESRVRPAVDGLKVRSTAGGSEIGSVVRSDIGTVLDGPKRASYQGMDYAWWVIKWDNGLLGWSASKRYVLNPAGIDLADGIFWDDLGMTNNDWIQVEFLFITPAPTPTPTSTATPTQTQIPTPTPTPTPTATPCKADFTAQPRVGVGATTVQLTDESTGNPTSWAWDFNGDEVIDSTLQNPKYTYESPGNYTVSLYITTANCVDKVTKLNYITITPTPCKADFTAQAQSRCGGYHSSIYR